jgi:biotin carboxyl carrier protein
LPLAPATPIIRAPFDALALRGRLRASASLTCGAQLMPLCRQLASVVLAAALASLSSGAAAATASPANNAAQLDDQFVVATGCRIVYVDSVELASERRGILADIVAPGAALPAGGEVARLRDAVLKATMAIAEREATNDIEVRFAAKAAGLADLKHQRALQANQQSVGTVSDLELRELRLAAERATLQFEQAEHRLAVAKLRVEEIRASVDALHIKAPFAAFVRAVYKRPGEVVQEGEVVAELVSPSRIRVEGDVPLAALPWVTPQAEVLVRLTDPSTDTAAATPSATTAAAPADFVARITFVDMKVEPVSRTVRIAAELDNRDGRLREGLSATLLISKRAPQQAATPAAAVTR